MARKNVSKVVSKFLAGQAGKGDSHGAIWTDGDVIYSYAMPIVVRMGEKSVLVSKDSPTVTTSCHIGGVRYLLSREGYSEALASREAVKTASNIPKGPAVKAA